MPSISEPPTPIRSIDLVDDLFVASCIELDHKGQVNSEDEISNALRRARYHALRTKRETLERFLRDHSKEDLTNYIEGCALTKTYIVPIDNKYLCIMKDDIDDLRSFARSNGGLIDDEYRSIIWPILSNRLMTIGEGEEDYDDTISSCTEFESAVSDLSENEDGDFDIEDFIT